MITSILNVKWVCLSQAENTRKGEFLNSYRTD